MMHDSQRKMQNSKVRKILLDILHSYAIISIYALKKLIKEVAYGRKCL